MGAGFPVGIERAKSALGAISSDLPYDDWWTVLCAAKAAGVEKECVRDWSARSPGYDEQQFEASWRGTSDAGGIGAGTLFAIAQRDWGWDGTRAPRGARLSAADRERIATERAARDAEAQKTRQGAQAAAAKRAEYIWSHRAAPNGASPYLTRKGVPAIGVRFRSGGVLVVPLRDESGKLWNLQFIQPDGRKVFLKRGRVQACWHWLGGAPAEQFAGVIAVAEGYATASTVHIATGHATAVAFNGANLRAVAMSLRQRYPAAGIVICGDDARHLLNRPKGKNKGRECAMRAATAANGVAVFAPDLQGEEKDFNDVAPRVGLPRIAEHINVAAQAQSAREVVDPASACPPTSSAPASDRAANDDAVEDQDPFSISDRGVFFRGRDKEGRLLPAERICSRLEVLARTRDLDDHSWGYWLRYRDPLGRTKHWAMPARMLAGDGAELRGVLLSLGVDIPAVARTRALLTQYLQTRGTTAFYLCTDRTGWHGRQYVLTRETIGESEEPLVFQDDGAAENRFRVRGDVDVWRTRVGSLCVGNSRLLFGASLAFASVMLRPAGLESGGFHLRGDSSSGKTTALRVAASVFGGPSYMQRWRATDSALESLASQHSDALLVLDEIAQVDSKIIGETVYMLANEAGRARANRSGLARPRLTWRLLFLSAGEIGLAEHMAEASKRARVGQELRMVDVPVEAGAGHAGFEQLHGSKNGADFSQRIVRECSSVFGAPGDAFIRWAVANADSLPSVLRERMDAALAQWLSAAASGQVNRVARRFALVGVAGELATAAGCTGWPEGAAIQAAQTCFAAWLSARGGDGNGEERLIMQQVRAWFAANAEGRFTYWHRANDDRSPRTMNRAGFRRLVNRRGEAIALGVEGEPSEFARQDAEAEFYVFVDIFRAEVCRGLDCSAVLRLLDRRGHIRKATTGQFTRTERLPGLGSAQVYRILPSLFADDGQP